MLMIATLTQLTSASISTWNGVCRFLWRSCSVPFWRVVWAAASKMNGQMLLTVSGLQCTLHNRNEQFFQVGLQDRALISLGLALRPPSTSISSNFMVLCFLYLFFTVRQNLCTSYPSCTFPLLLFLRCRPFSSFSCLRRTWLNGIKDDVWRGSVNRKQVNLGSAERMTTCWLNWCMCVLLLCMFDTDGTTRASGL